jgi:hypothetical protein
MALKAYNTRFGNSLAGNKAFANKVASRKTFIFSLQLPSNIVSLFKHFGRQRFQNGLKQTAKTLCRTVGHNTFKLNLLQRNFTIKQLMTFMFDRNIVVLF